MSRDRAQALLCESFGPFGKIELPYYRMGKIDSLNLFGENELMILAFYWHNRKRYRHAIDIGANIGLHSICMAKCGWGVMAYEPDPTVFKHLAANLMANHVLDRVHPEMRAVHIAEGNYAFTRVLANLTGSHIKGYKKPYGDLEEIVVATEDCRRIWPRAEFAKVDCEGNEAELIKTLTPAEMCRLELMIEVNNAENAQAIYWHLRDLGIPMWPQKVNWCRAQSADDLPRNNREGSLFVGQRGPWE